MLNKWWMVALGLVIFQGSMTFTMDSPRGRKTSLNCSQEIQKEPELAAVLLKKASSKDLHAQEKEAAKYMYYAYCGGNSPVEYYPFNLQGNCMRDVYPYYPGR